MSEVEVAAVVPPEPVAVTPVPPVGEPDWLPKRLEQAKSSASNDLLKALGVESLEAAKERLAELDKIKEAQLTENERTAKRLAELEPRATRATQLEETLSKYAAGELAGLTESQALAVKDLAGEDPANILRTIERLKPTWAAVAPPVVAPVTTTTAQQSGPPDTGHQSTVDHAAEYKRLKSTNPFEAARFLRTHSVEISSSQS